MIKRRFYLTLVAALILLITSLLWGCGDEKSTKSVSGSKETKPITMRIAHSYPETTQHHRRNIPTVVFRYLFSPMPNSAPLIKK